MNRPASAKPKSTITTMPPATIPRIHQTALLPRRCGGIAAGGLPEALDIIHPLPVRRLQIRNGAEKCFACARTVALIEAHFHAGMPVEVYGIDEAHFGFLERHDQGMSA